MEHVLIERADRGTRAEKKKNIYLYMNTQKHIHGFTHTLSLVLYIQSILLLTSYVGTY